MSLLNLAYQLLISKAHAQSDAGRGLLDSFRDQIPERIMEFTGGIPVLVIIGLFFAYVFVDAIKNFQGEAGLSKTMAESFIGVFMVTAIWGLNPAYTATSGALNLGATHPNAGKYLHIDFYYAVKRVSETVGESVFQNAGAEKINEVSVKIGDNIKLLSMNASCNGDAECMQKNIDYFDKKISEEQWKDATSCSAIDIGCYYRKVADLFTLGPIINTLFVIFDFVRSIFMFFMNVGLVLISNILLFFFMIISFFAIIPGDQERVKSAFTLVIAAALFNFVAISVNGVSVILFDILASSIGDQARMTSPSVPVAQLLVELGMTSFALMVMQVMALAYIPSIASSIANRSLTDIVEMGKTLTQGALSLGSSVAISLGTAGAMRGVGLAGAGKDRFNGLVDKFNGSRFGGGGPGGGGSSNLMSGSMMSPPGSGLSSPEPGSFLDSARARAAKEAEEAQQKQAALQKSEQLPLVNETGRKNLFTKKAEKINRPKTVKTPSVDLGGVATSILSAKNQDSGGEKQFSPKVRVIKPKQQFNAQVESDNAGVMQSPVQKNKRLAAIDPSDYYSSEDDVEFITPSKVKKSKVVAKVASPKTSTPSVGGAQVSEIKTPRKQKVKPVSAKTTRVPTSSAPEKFTPQPQNIPSINQVDGGMDENQESLFSLLQDDSESVPDVSREDVLKGYEDQTSLAKIKADEKAKAIEFAKLEKEKRRKQAIGYVKGIAVGGGKLIASGTKAVAKTAAKTGLSITQNVASKALKATAELAKASVNSMANPNEAFGYANTLTDVILQHKPYEEILVKKDDDIAGRV